jgi:hypothetical protein
MSSNVQNQPWKKKKGYLNYSFRSDEALKVHFWHLCYKRKTWLNKILFRILEFVKKEKGLVLRVRITKIRVD